MRLSVLYDHVPTVRPLHIDSEEGPNVVFLDTCNPQSLEQALKSSTSNIEVYFQRPADPSFHSLKFTDYFEDFAGTMPDDAKKPPSTVHGATYNDLRSPPRPIWKRQRKRVCRVPPIGPRQGEKFFLYILLKNIPARSFCEIRTVIDTTHDSYRDAVKAHGLMSDDNEHVLCLEQAMRELGWNGNPLDESREPCGPALRPLFVCLIHEGADWQALHDMAGDALLDDFLQEAGDHDEAHEQFLQDIACRMRAMGRDPKRDFNIPLPQTESSELERAHAMTTKNNKRYHDEYHAAENQMTDQQRQIYDTVVKSDTQDNGGCFYIDGKAGRGKSTVIRAITARLRHDGHVVLNTASTGVAALDYEAGSTAHLPHTCFTQIQGRETSLLCYTGITAWPATLCCIINHLG